MSSLPREPSGPPPYEEHLACLGLGSNVEPASNLPRAIQHLRTVVSVEDVSTAWESSAVGSDGPDYVNAALLVRTSLTRDLLMATLKQIERQLGRTHNLGRQTGRLTIDIDMVVYDREILEEDLWSQAYRAVPVAELLPDLRCAATGELLSHAAARLACAFAIKARPEILLGSQPAGTSRAGDSDSTRTSKP